MVRGGAPCTLIALQKNALAAVTSRLVLSFQKVYGLSVAIYRPI